MHTTCRDNAGFTLLELMITLVIMGIIVALVIPSSSPGIDEQLNSAARIAAAELSYARNLAVTHNSSYRVTLDAAQERFVLEHSGSDATLDELPSSPFRASTDPFDQHIFRFDSLTGISQPVTIVTSYAGQNPPAIVTDVQFGPFGETSRAEPTFIVLETGVGVGRRLVALQVNPVTGLTTVTPIPANGGLSGAPTTL